MLWYALIFLGSLIEGEFTILGLCVLDYRRTLDLNLEGMVAAACLGAFLGDWFWYEVGRRSSGSPFSFWPALARRLEKVGQFLARYPVIAILLIRFQIACRTLGNYAFGRGGVARGRYLVVNGISCFAWAAVIVPFCRWFVTIMGQLLSATWGY